MMKVEMTMSRKEEIVIIEMLQKRKADTRTIFMREVLERDQKDQPRFSL
jgi:hypothetical protein